MLTALGTAGALLPAAASPAAAASPERRSRGADFGPKQRASGSRGLAITGHAESTRIAVEVLRQGGNACDALLAASLAQTVLQPHLTTVTGCFSLLYRDAATGRSEYLNANVNAPLAPLTGFGPADVFGGRGVAVPGFWAGIEAAHQAYSSMPLARLIAPAIALARDGVECEPFFWGELFAAQVAIGANPAGRRIFMPARALPPPGGTVRQPEAADLLERLRDEGSRYFYHGSFAERFCAIVRQAGGVLTPEDFARYAVRREEPVRGTYRGLDVVAAAPPDMGGLHLIETLNIAEQIDIARLGPASESPEVLVHLMRAVREVMTAGAAYGDPRYVPLDRERILSKAFARERMQAQAPAQAAPVAPPGSCHLTVVDRHGNIATALHSTLSLPWVNGLFIDGVSICGAANHFLRTMPPPGARVSVMICPSLILREGRPLIACGSPSTSLIATLAQNITNIVDCGMDIAESVRRATFGGLADADGRMTIEADIGDALLAAVAGAGIQAEKLNPWSFRNGSFEGIFFDPHGTAHACGDPRRTSVAMAV
ncbi:gamma-glutamyltransferase [Sphingomonas canadensis]|uniref:Gamma-glutamyltransferase n=2 Tax=Sphingomonas canadensis TaxID=1219257 RepID=A0ABW3HA39_9SPHN|nr:gamma-glutamyltransferase [Sphingomonas canadensis]MCW3838105.1 gamma-glutamyltransferase [Sphingomonas canadensis]